MTRTEAIAIITAKLETADDATLEAAARHLASLDDGNRTVNDMLEVVASSSALPRPLTSRELELVEQSKDDFKLGRTRTHDQSRAHVDTELERRRRLRTSV